MDEQILFDFGEDMKFFISKEAVHEFETKTIYSIGGRYDNDAVSKGL